MPKPESLGEPSLFSSLFPGQGKKALGALFGAENKYKKKDARTLGSGAPPPAPADAQRLRSDGEPPAATTKRSDAPRGEPASRNRKAAAKSSGNQIDEPIETSKKRKGSRPEDAAAQKQARSSQQAETEAGPARVKRQEKGEKAEYKNKASKVNQRQRATEPGAIEARATGEADGRASAHVERRSGEDDEPGCIPTSTDEGMREGRRDRDEEEKLRRTVFVGNAPASIKRKKLKQLFSRCGRVESVRLRSVTVKSDVKMDRRGAVASGNVVTDRGGVNAYVVFSAEAEALAAVGQLNMHTVEDRQLRVDRAAAPRRLKPDGGSEAAAATLFDHARTVFVGNLPFDLDEEELRALFNSGEAAPELEGAVQGVRMLRDAKTQQGKGIAYVLLKHKTATRAALALDGHELHERKIRVTRCKPPTSLQSAGTRQTKSPSWQGAKTKGRGRDGAGRAKPGKSATPPGVRAGGAQKRKLANKRTGKRPAVAARKAAAKAAKSR